MSSLTPAEFDHLLAALVHRLQVADTFPAKPRADLV